MEKFVLSLNSHSLSVFQECETKYLYSQLLNIQGLGSSVPMEKGTLYAKFLQTYYQGKISPRESREKYLANAPLWIKRIRKVLKCDRSEAFYLFGAMQSYTEKYEAETWIPLAVERGFSKVLYEDDNVRFIYEGRPDLLVLSDKVSKVRLPVDHKTQGASNSFYQHNNQALGYMFNYEALKFCYNYIVFNQVPEFRREVFNYHQGQIDAWKSETIEWYFRIKNVLEKKTFLKTLNCQGRFSLCSYTSICERPTQEQKLYEIKARYLPKKPYRSW